MLTRLYHDKYPDRLTDTGNIQIYLQTLYESSIAFGIRKALQAEQGKTDMENYIAKLEEEKAALEKEVKLRDLASFSDIIFSARSQT